MLFLWRHGLWLLIAVALYALAWAFYRGAVVVAHHYGTAMAAVIDLNRFTLYDRLRVAQPDSTRSERARNAALNSLLNFVDTASVPYVKAPNQLDT